MTPSAFSPEAMVEAARPASRPARAVARWKADAALIANTFIWGSTFVVVKNALADISTVLFLAIRFALAGAILLVLARRVRPGRALLRASGLVGGSLFLGYLFQTWGLLFTTPSKSAFITGVSIVLVPVMVAVAYRRFAGWAPLAGVAAATAGLYLLTNPFGGGGINPGDLLTLVCAFAFALHIILIGHYSPLVPARGLAAGQVAAAFVLAAASAPWAEPLRFRPSAALVVAVVVTALLATALAFFIQTWAQQFTTPTHTALIFSMEPVFASLTSWAVLGERLSGEAWAGGLLILAGIVIAEVFAPKH